MITGSGIAITAAARNLPLAALGDGIDYRPQPAAMRACDEDAEEPCDRCEASLAQTGAYDHLRKILTCAASPPRVPPEHTIAVHGGLL